MKEPRGMYYDIKISEIIGGRIHTETMQPVYFKMEADRYIVHQKRKRCEALADLNWWQANRYSAAEMVERIRWNLEEARQCSKLEEKYLKRYHKWLELAEKLKQVAI